MFSRVTFDVIYFRVMANIKPQSSLTQQQGMQVSFLLHGYNERWADLLILIYHKPAGCGLD